MEERPICPDCGEAAEFLTSSERVYGGNNHGPIYICWGCDTRVGCHKKTGKPLGTMAGKKLRAARTRAHDAFDPTWDDDKWPGKQKAPMKRRPAYAWLSERMNGKDGPEFHMGSSTVEECDRVVEVSERYLDRKRKERAHKEGKWKG